MNLARQEGRKSSKERLCTTRIIPQEMLQSLKLEINIGKILKMWVFPIFISSFNDCSISCGIILVVHNRSFELFLPSCLAKFIFALFYGSLIIKFLYFR